MGQKIICTKRELKESYIYRQLPLDKRLDSGHVIDKNNCWNWTKSCMDDGYPRIRIKHRDYRVSRIIYERYNNMKLSKDMCVCHKCDNKKCINPEHLFSGTIANNNMDKELKGRGRHPKGTDNHSKLTEKEVRQIRKLKDKYTNRQLAEMFNIGKSNVSAIQRRELWRHIK